MLRRLLTLAAFAAALVSGQPACVSITGPLYQLGAGPLIPLINGSTIDITLPRAVGGVVQSIVRISPIAGAFTTCLPGGTTYTAKYTVRNASPAGGTSIYTRSWVVPSGGGPYTAGSVETSAPVVPATTLIPPSQIAQSGASTGWALIWNGFSYAPAAAPPASGVLWGTITGAITDQPDLQAALAGIVGQPGTQGIQGIPGPPGADSTVAGPQGIQGIQGIQGSPGTGTGGAAVWGGITGTITDQADLQAALAAVSIGATGPKGDKGDTGATGAQGSAGATGSTGPQGIQGIPGGTGPAGADSTVAGPQGIQGIQGIQGNTGTTGNTGATGPAGPAPAGTGIVYTTGGVPAIAVPVNFPTLNQPTTGNAATASALASTPTLCTGGQVPTGVLANGNATGCAAPSAALAAQYKVKTCFVSSGDKGAATAVLADDNDLPNGCRNDTGVDWTITAVACWADTGSPTVTPVMTGGTATSLLTGALTCGTASWAAGTLAASPVVHSFSGAGMTTCSVAPCSIDLNITTAGGVAKLVEFNIVGTY